MSWHETVKGRVEGWGQGGSLCASSVAGQTLANMEDRRTSWAGMENGVGSGGLGGQRLGCPDTGGPVRGEDFGCGNRSTRLGLNFGEKKIFLISLLYGDWTVGFIKKGGREGHLGGSVG